jgi:Spy/CpxP family protein refolding chaperone
MGLGGFGMMGGAMSTGGGGMLNRGLLAAFRQLDLTPVQREQVRTIMFNASESQRMKAATEQQAGGAQQALDDFAVLANPGDPNYARAVQQLKSRATQRVQDSIQLATDTGQKLYNVLTADQKAQLPKVLDDLKARAQQRMNDLRARRQGGASQPPPGGQQPPR